MNVRELREMSIERMVLAFADFFPLAEVLKAVGKRTAARPSNISKVRKLPF